MEKILSILKKIIPTSLFSFLQPTYHLTMAYLGAWLYGFPSKKLFVIVVTGTKGKSSTTEIINAILEKAGYTTALSNTIRFKIANQSRPNLYKMSMPGRMFMQRFLRRAVKAGCTHAVLEMTSLGATQFRHKLIGTDIFVFTNLAPEHIEAHGSFNKYREDKASLVEYLGWGEKDNPKIILNADDSASIFFEKTAKEKSFITPKTIWYGLKEAHPYTTTNRGTNLTYKNNLLITPLIGEFNISNTLAAIKTAEVIGISDSDIAQALAKLQPIKGRVEYVKAGQPFDVVVDYAHTPDSLKALYQAFPNNAKVCVLGNTGGGRDTWKRPEMAKIANEHCYRVILTNEDPYDEDPVKIIDEMKTEVDKKKLFVILNRREALNKAIELAKEITEKKGRKKNPIVLITGKGTDPYIMGPNDSKIPWSDFQVAKEEIEKVYSSQ